MTKKNEPEDTKNITWLYLPMTQTQIERAMLRAGIDTYDDMRLCFDSSEFPNEVDVVLDFERESIGSLNEMCKILARLDRADMPKLAAAVTMSKPEYQSTRLRQKVLQGIHYDRRKGAPECYHAGAQQVQ